MGFGFSELNWLRILIATIAYSAFSEVWHRQFAFGKKGKAAMGFERPEGSKETNIYYIVPLIGCFLASIAIALLHNWIGISNLKLAVLLVVTVGLGIGTTVTFTNAVIPIMNKPTTFGLITGTAHAISLTLVSILIHLI